MERPDWLTVAQYHEAVGYKRAVDIVASTYHQIHDVTVEQLLRSGRLVAGGPCPDCLVPPGVLHGDPCLIARCAVNGGQRAAHGPEVHRGRDCGEDTWTGERYRDEAALQPGAGPPG